MTATSDIIIIGAGAAGLFCAAKAGQSGKSVTLIEHTEKLGEKIRISGGGRCNFTNMYSGPENFLSRNPHFAKSALARYTPWDFVALVDSYNIAWHEKTLGQLFCDGKSTQIIDMLKAECTKGGVKIRTSCHVETVYHRDGLFHLKTSQGELTATKLVIATGGLSIPKIGASPFGYQIAKQFGLSIIDPRPALVPLTFTDSFADDLKALSGVSHDVRVTDQNEEAGFTEAMLMTHRGLSGPAILQISSYWQEGETISLDLLPGQNASDWLSHMREAHPKLSPANALAKVLPERLADLLCRDIAALRLAELTREDTDDLVGKLEAWTLKPAGSEGYRTAEVTLGGVDTNMISSKTMEAKTVPGLYFIGEVVDVTGHLGGHNFQWAWASAQACALAMAEQP